jgi:aspartate aminotransferase-like enzyme
LCFVFYAHEIAPEPTRLPRYLDLGYYAAKQGIPFTHSSNLIGALDAALSRFTSDEPFHQLQHLSRLVRPRLREMGWAPLVADSASTPAVVTVALTNGFRAAAIGERLGREGLLIAHHSEYLAERNWFQVSLMGHRSVEPVECLLAAFGRIAAHH